MKAEKFLKLIARIKEPELFLGIAKILGVQLINTNKVGPDGHCVPFSFEEILDQVLINYALAPSKRQREIDQILKEALSDAAASKS